MKKILLLTSHFSEQDSVSNITENIILSYKQMADVKVKTLAIEEYSSTKNTNYDFIIIVHPIVILAHELKLIINSPSNKDTTFIFYIFGDLMRKSGQLITLEESLINKKVHFIAASRSYESMLKKCFKNIKEISLIPFPLNQKNFYYDLSLREKFRRKHKITPADKVLIYTGRISAQKNIDYLIQTYERVKRENVSIKLFIYGNIDEFEMPTFYERKYGPGSYFNQIKKTLMENSNNEIYLFPRTTQKKLNEAYNGCDLFVSMSLYHDEDFGYSPLEALSCGTPAWLTSWGGYKDLERDKKIPNSVNYLKVDFKKGFLELNDKQAQASLSNAIKKTKRSAQISKIYHKDYSIEVSSASYSKLLNKKITTFTGFTSRFIDFSLSMYLNQKVDLVLYKTFYQNFWKN